MLDGETIGIVAATESPWPNDRSDGSPSGSAMQSWLTASPVAGGGGNRQASQVIVGALPVGFTAVAVSIVACPGATSGGSALTASRRSLSTNDAGSNELVQPAAASVSATASVRTRARIRSRLGCRAPAER